MLESMRRVMPNLLVWPTCALLPSRPAFPRWEESRFPGLLLDVLESLFKLGDQRSLAGRETVASHHAPEVITARTLVSVEHGHDIFRWSACHKNNDVSL
jgi:hypothetical protein